MPNYFMLIVADTPSAVGAVLESLDAEGRPQPAYGSPRAIQVSDLMDYYDGLSLYDLVLRPKTTVQVVRVTPLGQVLPHHEFYDMDADVDEFGPEEPVQAEHGWQVAEVLGLADVLGPQGQQVIDALREGLRLEDIDGGLEAYGVVGDALDVEVECSAAESALDTIGVDTCWLGTVGCFFAYEVTALAARDLIDAAPTVPEWTQVAYDALTQAWRATIPHPLHSDDAPLPGVRETIV